MTTSTPAADADRLRAEQAREAVLLRLPVEPGWRLCDADPLEDFETTGRVAAVCEPLTAVAVRGDALRVLMFSGSGPQLVPLRSSGKPCSGLARFYAPTDTRSDDVLFSEYVDALRAGPMPLRTGSGLVAGDAVPAAAPAEQAQRVSCPGRAEAPR